MRSQSLFDLNIGLVLRDYRELASDFCHIVFSFIRRSANKAAYCLARLVCSLPDPREWDIPPSLLIDVLALDVSI